MIKPQKPKRSGLQVIEEGNGDFCSQCGSTMDRRFRILGGLFQFGKIINCHNCKCNNLSTISQQQLSADAKASTLSNGNVR